MLKKILDKLFPKKYVLVNLRRGGFVGERYNLVPYKRNLTKSQNKKHISVFYPWKNFPLNFLKGFKKSNSTTDHCLELRMVENTFRLKWWAIYNANRLVRKIKTPNPKLQIIGIGEIIDIEYLSADLPYYKTEIIDIIRAPLSFTYDLKGSRVFNHIFSVNSTHLGYLGYLSLFITEKEQLKMRDLTGPSPPSKNYWATHDAALEYMQKIDSLYPDYCLCINTDWLGIKKR